jgi:hypothetical protein
MVSFSIPDYTGISRTSFSEWHAQVELDNNNRGTGAYPLSNAIAEQSYPTQPVVSFLAQSPRLNPDEVAHPGNSLLPAITFKNLSPGGDTLTPKPFYHLGAFPTWPAKFNSNQQSYSVDFQQDSYVNLTTLVDWMFPTSAALLLSAIFGTVGYFSRRIETDEARVLEISQELANREKVQRWQQSVFKREAKRRAKSKHGLDDADS